MPPFKDEHVLIIAPGSQTTQAQLGLPETFTPPRWRFPTRMFPGLRQGEWEPIKIRTKSVTKSVAEPAQHLNGVSENKSDDVTTTADTSMVDAPSEAKTRNSPAPQVNGTSAPDEDNVTITEEVFEDDPFDVEDAVYPMKEGRVENWPCFFAVLSHIYKFISPPFHMPVIVISQPCWTARDKEWITQYFFENWKIPALCLMDSALAAVYAYGISSATVIDVGVDKCDVSAVSEFIVHEIGRGVALPGCGGDDMTRRLMSVLKGKGYGEVTWQLAEQLKKSPICEILPPGVPYPNSSRPPTSTAPENPAAAASTGAMDSGPNAKDADGQSPGQAARGPGNGTEVGLDAGDEEDNEGVLDVAAIVARDNAAELLAKREKEKAERAAAKKGALAQDQKQIRLRNSERERAAFLLEEYIPQESGNGSRKRKREVEVGIERFMATTPPTGEGDGVLDKIATAVHSTIMKVPDVTSRAALWDNLIVLGNGSRVRGFGNALVETLKAQFTLSPSTGTIFTSELPSNFTTPVPTNGTNTPIPGQASSHQMHPTGHGGVNPLLVAATKNMMQPGGTPQHLQLPGQHGGATPVPGMDPAFHQSYRGFSQSPTSMKTVKPPDYFPEWKDPSVSGMEDAVFLGAQVAAKVVFIVDGGISKGFLTRTDYNEMGPEGIHTCAM